MLNDWLTTYRNERGEELSPAQVANEEYRTLHQAISHEGCGGPVQIAHMGTGRTATCRECGAKWRDTFGPAGWIRLEAYGGA